VGRLQCACDNIGFRLERRGVYVEGSSVEVEAVGEEESMGVEVAEGNGWGACSNGRRGARWWCLGGGWVANHLQKLNPKLWDCGFFWQ
jgi:hypothetical protein